MAKSKKITPNQNKIQLVIMHRKTTLIVSACMLLILLFAVGFYQYITEADKRSVGVMRDDVTQLIKDIENKRSGIAWSDDSFCTIVKPRNFGDRTKYSCTILHQSRQKVAHQGEINTMVNMQIEVLNSSEYLKFHNSQTVEYPQYTNDTSILNQPTYKKVEQQSAIGFELKRVASARCTIQYELTNGTYEGGVEVLSKLTCYKETSKAYFNSVQYI